jgi:hypothetical protein
MDGIAADAGHLAPRLGLFHMLRWIGSCTPSRWGGTGKLKAAAAKAIACRYAKSRLRVLALHEQPFDVATDGLDRCGQHRTPGVEDNSPPGFEAGQFSAHCFPHSSPHAIAHHGFTHGAGNSETDFRPVLLIRTRDTKRGEVLAGKAKAFIIDLAKIAGPQYPVPFREPGWADINGDRFTRRDEQRARHSR